jgi:hypothetical protein
MEEFLAADPSISVHRRGIDPAKPSADDEEVVRRREGRGG